MEYDINKYAEHLAGMLRFKTVSNSDQSKMDFEEFYKMHSYMEEIFPLVHKTLEKHVLGKAALLFYWKGTGKSKRKPLLLMAHQDVVPEGDWAKWKYSPFDGHIDEEGVLYGRGATDCKNLITYEMEAVEALIAEGFQPDYDLYLAFGYNEEIMAEPKDSSCTFVKNYLKEKGVELGMVIDEGLSCYQMGDTVQANIVMAEKGYVDHEFFIEAKGGHSAFPPAHNNLGLLCKAIYELEENNMDYFLSEDAKITLKAQAPGKPEEVRKYYEDPEKYFEELKALSVDNRELNAFLRTTTTPSMAVGSAQANILPERPAIICNSRILPGQTIEELEEHFRKVLPPEVQFRRVKGTNPPKSAPVTGPEFELLAKIMADKYGKIDVIPLLSAGGTDSRNYTDITAKNCVYRINGGLFRPTSGGEHAVNERLDTATMDTYVDFFVRVISEYGGIEE